MKYTLIQTAIENSQNGLSDLHIINHLVALAAIEAYMSREDVYKRLGELNVQLATRMKLEGYVIDGITPMDLKFSVFQRLAHNFNNVLLEFG